MNHGHDPIMNKFSEGETLSRGLFSPSEVSSRGTPTGVVRQNEVPSTPDKRRKRILNAHQSMNMLFNTDARLRGQSQNWPRKVGAGARISKRSEPRTELAIGRSHSQNLKKI